MHINAPIWKRNVNFKYKQLNIKSPLTWGQTRACTTAYRPTYRCPGLRPCSSSAGGSCRSDRPGRSRRSLSSGSVRRTRRAVLLWSASSVTVQNYYIMGHKVKLRDPDLMNDNWVGPLVSLTVFKFGRELLGKPDMEMRHCISQG